MLSLNKCRINVMVSNMDLAIDFYIQKLGLELINRYADHYAEIQAPGLFIGLHQKDEKVIVGNNLSIGFGVSKFDASIEELNKKGIDLRLEQDGWIRLAYFKDPDDNPLFLAENKVA